MIIPCNCIHPDQDQINGRGQRVHNETKKRTARCTVCKAEKQFSGQPVKDGKNGKKSG